MRYASFISDLAARRLPGVFRVMALSLVAACALSAACSSSSVSQLKHDLSAPVRDAAAHNWQSATDSDYAEIMAPLVGLNTSSILPASNPLVQRAQFWLDQIDASLRSKFPVQLVDVPKPQAKVLKIGVPNAFVAPVPTCYNVQVQVGSVVAYSGRKVFIDVQTGALAVWPEDLKCKDGEASRSGLVVAEAFVKKFNIGAGSCRYSLTATGILRPSSACTRDPEVAALGVSAGVVMMETSNFITVHSGLLKIMSEGAFVSVLAHELGHYYRSHVTAKAGEYDYFYTLKPTGPDHKPVPELDKATLGQAAVAASSMLAAADNFLVVGPAQQLRSDLFVTVGSLVTQVAALSGAPEACYTAAALLKSPGFKTTMGLFPLTKVSSPQLVDTYMAGEHLLLGCLAALKFTAHGGLEARSVSFDAIRSLASQPTWPDFISSLAPPAQARLSALNKLVSARIGDQAPNSQVALDAVLALSHAFADQDKQSLGVLKLVHDQHLGQFTTEQEADDVSAEWIAGLGFDPKFGVDSMRSLGAGMKTGLGGNVLAEADCERLWKAGWLGADGNYSFVPVGNFTDPHHSVCYRMFNIEREIKAHKLAVQGVAPTASGPSWAELQTLATSLVPTAVNSRNAAMSLVSPFVAATGAMSCSYSYMYQH